MKPLLIYGKDTLWGHGAGRLALTIDKPFRAGAIYITLDDAPPLRPSGMR